MSTILDASDVTSKLTWSDVSMCVSGDATRMYLVGHDVGLGHHDRLRPIAVGVVRLRCAAEVGAVPSSGFGRDRRVR